jgi:hypothetical protein
MIGGFNLMNVMNGKTVYNDFTSFDEEKIGRQFWPTNEIIIM